MPVGVETSLNVEVLNTLVTAVATMLILFVSPGLQKWLSRRYWNTVSQGKTRHLLVSDGFDGFREFVWKVRRPSVGGTERRRMVLDLLPYVLVIAGLQLLPFSTSGVGADSVQQDGSSVTVVGSLANPTGDIIETLDLTNLWSLQKGEFNGDATPFLLGSPELFNYGTDVVGLDWGVYFSGTGTDDSTETEDGATDLKIYGERYTVEQDGEGQGTYLVTTCLTLIATETATESDSVYSAGTTVYSAGTCSGVRVQLEAIEFVVESVHRVEMTTESCSDATYAIFNQGLTYRWRTLTLNETSPFTEVDVDYGTEVEAVCGEIFESFIEACIFEVGDHLYVGDWNIGQFEDTCGDDDYTPTTLDMTIVEIDASSGMLPSSEEYQVSVAMLAEIVAGSGNIFSRQQLALVLGVFSRLSAMKLGVGTAYYPETVVVVSISRVVIVLWVLLFVAGCVIHIRERCLDREVFIPSKAWDWYAVGAREALGDGDASGPTPPSDHHYLAKYGCQKSLVEESDGVVQRLCWVGSRRKEAEVMMMGAGETLPIPPPLRQRSSALGEAVQPSKKTPRSINTPLRRPGQS
ncbi:unnamed protein product [Ectocarpus sp. 12 AP-2014]